jgi:FkbM family methyltransferase
MTQDKQQASLYSQNTDFACIEVLLPHLKQRSFIDIGAEKGTFTTFLSSHGLHGSLFEPLPKFASCLSELAQATGNQFLSYAIDQVDRSADFYSAYDSTDTPMDYFSSLHPLNSDTRITHKKVTTVTCRSLDSLLREGLISEEIGILKTDTEGNDLNVLKGMRSLKSDILMCEYFMPGIYAGWELGHPAGLIEAAKQLGFSHFIAIKRIQEFEQVSLDNDTFIDKQWGNLIFLSDSIFHAAYADIKTFIAKKDIEFLNFIIQQTDTLKKTCEERMHVIHTLDSAVQELRIEVNRPVNQIFMQRLKSKLGT